MYFEDHAPSHFHAKYNEFEITVDIHTGIVTGRFSRRALCSVLEWYDIHQKELLENWELARLSRQLKKIEPLE